MDANPLGVRLVYVRFVILGLCCAIVSCNARKVEPALSERLVGEWRIDVEGTEYNMREWAADHYVRPPSAVDEAVKVAMSGVKDNRLVFKYGRFEYSGLPNVRTGRYEVVREGSKVVIIRQFHDASPDDHAKDLQEKMDVPHVSGIEFIDDDHIRCFEFRKRNGNVTLERYLSPHLYERVK